MRKLLLGLAALVLLAGLGAATMLWWGSGPKPGPHTLIVEQGSSVAKVAGQLEQLGAIPGTATTFRGFAKLLGGGDPVQAGEFQIPKGASAASILDLLQHGQPVQRLLTVTEGMPSIIVQERLVAATELTGAAPLAGEGTILPDSYSYRRGETRAAVLGRMTAAMDKQLAALWAKRKPTAVVTSPAQAIILASIVEKETGKAAERRMVAGVYSNRLRIGMKLDADPTVIYPITKGKPLGRRILKSELNAITGYNTYREVGLPAGPIANPGRASIAAVLDPAPTKALYFVADGTGGHVFADTLDEHNANVAKWFAIRRARGEM
ncbi:MAG: endolytic transglycosylase MltG [Sphingomicrobium sp.]